MCIYSSYQILDASMFTKEKNSSLISIDMVGIFSQTKACVSLYSNADNSV